MPLWIPRLLPVVDQPNHLAAISIWNHLDDPSWGFARYYRYSRDAIPYWGYYAPVHFLSYLFELETANKLYLSMYAVATPLSVSAFATQFGRSPFLGLLAVPLAYSNSFAWGFLSFAPAVPTMLFALVLLARFYQRPSVARWFALLLLVMLTYFMHLLPWLLLGLLATIFVVGHARQRRTGLAAAAALAASLAFAIWNTIHASRVNPVVTRKLHFAAGYERLRTLLHGVPTRLLMRWPGWTLYVIELGLAACVVALVLTARTERRPRAFDAWYPEICAVVALVCYLRLPARVSAPVWIWMAGTRFAAVAALFALVVVRGEISGARRYIVVAATFLIAFYCGELTWRFVAFNRRASGILAMIDRIPRGSTTLTLMLGDDTDPALDPTLDVYREFYSYPVALRGGYNPYGWNLGFPFEIVDERRLPAPTWYSPEAFSQRREGVFYDYVITRNEAGDGLVFGDLAHRVPLIARDGVWRLYRTRNIR